jgi:hypothetical protein
MPFQKGKEKTGGRIAGTSNRTTKEAKEILNEILFGELDHIREALAEIRETNKTQYLETLSKLLAYSLPKKTDMTSGDEKLPGSININVTTPEGAEQLKDFLNGQSDKGI